MPGRAARQRTFRVVWTVPWLRWRRPLDWLGKQEHDNLGELSYKRENTTSPNRSSLGQRILDSRSKPLKGTKCSSTADVGLRIGTETVRSSGRQTCRR